MQNDMVTRNFISYEVLIFSVVIEIAANTTILIGQYDIDSTLEQVVKKTDLP